MDTSTELFFDGDCPLCAREIALRRRLDRRGEVRFTDIAAPGFDASVVGVPWERLMGTIHARRADGALVTGVEAFREVYAALGIGLSPLVALSRLPGISHGLDAAYGLFARNRLRLTGRCADGRCAVPSRA